MKGLSRFTVVLLALAMSASCANFEFDRSMSVGKTVLIYMAADNNLAPYARQNLQAVMEGEVPDYFDEGDGNVLLVYADIDGDVPRLMRLSRDRYGVVNSEILVEYEEDQNSASDSVMNAVLTYAAGLFPSSENGLVLWSHGTGWLPEGYYSKPYSYGEDGLTVPMSVAEDPYASYVKSFGSDSGREMDIRDLAAALPVHYNYIIFDACLMGGVEVAYELREKCDYLVVSAAEVLAEGFPYGEIVGDLMAGNRSSLESVCDKFYMHYENEAATVALIDSRSLDRLASVCRDIISTGGRDRIQNLEMDSLQGYYRYDRHWFYDLDDFISRIAEEDRLSSFRTVMDDAVLYKRATDEFSLTINGRPEMQFLIKTFSGLSTYVPNPENPVLEEYYRTLAWNKAVRMVL